MKGVSPEGLGPLFTSEKDSFCDQQRALQFVRASELYDPVSGSRTLHTANQATDEEVAAAIAALEEER